MFLVHKDVEIEWVPVVDTEDMHTFEYIAVFILNLFHVRFKLISKSSIEILKLIMAFN